MDGRLTGTNCDEAGDYVVPNVLSPRDLVSRPDNMDETVLSSFAYLYILTKSVHWYAKRGRGFAENFDCCSASPTILGQP